MTRSPASARVRRTPPLPDWYDDAQCRGKSRLFYPPPSETASDRALRERYAGIVCAACAALADCRAWARDQHEFGFWGGESEAARAAAGFVPKNLGEIRVSVPSVARQAPSDGRTPSMVR